MNKYSEGFKLSVVKAYLDGQDGYREICRQRGLGHGEVREWVAAYKAHGIETFQTRDRNKITVDAIVQNDHTLTRPTIEVNVALDAAGVQIPQSNYFDFQQPVRISKAVQQKK